MNFSIGDTVGDYRILEELGRGGMGQVFRVEHTITKRLEAMKVLQGSRPDAPEQVERSMREIQVHASLDHPNIAEVHHAFWAGEDLVLIMELVEGSSLRRLLEAGKMPLTATLDYACQALSALSYAHGHGVTHRDVSPANMIVTPDGVLKLTDFGLARRPADARLSQSGAPLGSPYYMSPEQVRGDSAADPRSDVYSLGAVLYELASGKRPFESESAFSIMTDHVQTVPAPPSGVEPSLPPTLNSVILRSLEKDPANRFQSAEQFREALLKVLSSHVTRSSTPASPLPSIQGIWASAAGVVVVGVMATGLLRIQRPLGPNEPALATMPPAESGPSPVRREDTEPAPRPVETRPPPVRREVSEASRLPADTRPWDQPTIVRPPTKRVPNRLKRVLRKLWPFTRHPQASSEGTPPSDPSTSP
jgi:serine/threonine protein kinase